MGFLHIDHLKPGMMLNEDIYGVDRILRISKGTVLNEDKINIIERLGYMQINVRENTENVNKNSQVDEKKINSFKNKYTLLKDEVAGLIKYISDGNQIDPNQIYSIPKDLIEEVGSISELFKYLSRVDMLTDHTVGHSINVSLICSIICDWLKLDKSISKEVIIAGMLHDVGKSLIPHQIINKPGPLTEEEWSKVKKHPIYGYELLKRAKAPDSALIGALMHHERLDGNGYPQGLKQEKIPLIARIVAIADVYDAMTANRSYRSKICPFTVIKQFQYNYFGLLDTKVLMTFLAEIARCYMGEMVCLSNSFVGQVVFIDPSDPARPMVLMEDGLIFNLMKDRDVEIKSVGDM